MPDTYGYSRSTELRESRLRLQSMDESLAAIEQAWGNVAEMIVEHNERHSVEVELRHCVHYGFLDETLANDVKLDMWEVFFVLERARESYAEHVSTLEREALATEAPR